MTRTRLALADGREIIYFDDPGHDPHPDRTIVDTRALPARDDAPSMRFDRLTGEWVSIASHRMDRTHLPPADLCPLCPSRPGREPTEIPAADYDVVVFENRFPSFTGAPGEPAAGGPASDGAVDEQPGRPAIGRCEVVCFTSDHDAAFVDLDHRRARTVIEAWADRTTELSALPGVEQVVVFENRGREIGVTMNHPHGQIYAYPFVTPRGEALLREARRFRAASPVGMQARLLELERDDGRRVVLDGERWTAYVPFAARWPIEVHLLPHRDVRDLAGLDEHERDELADLYRELLRRVDGFFPGAGPVPYIAAWHQAPVGADRELFRLHLQVFSVLRAPGKLKYLAGSESAMGAWINDASPETIATRLREAGT